MIGATGLAARALVEAEKQMMFVVRFGHNGGYLDSNNIRNL
jgi:hypothetical protein